jgi:hypothetical protein
MIFLVVILAILTMAFLWREFYLGGKPWFQSNNGNYFTVITFINWSLIVTIIMLTINHNEAIVRFFGIERGINFLLDVFILFVQFNLLDIGYALCAISILSMSITTLWFFMTAAFKSWKISLIIALPILCVLLLMFKPNPSKEEGREFYNLFQTFYVLSGMIILTYVGYKYMILNEDIPFDSIVILAGWLLLLTTSLLATINVSAFNIQHFISFLSIKSIVYIAWIATLGRHLLVKRKKEWATT